MAQNRYYEDDDEMISKIPQQVLTSLSRSLARCIIKNSKDTTGQKRYGKDEKHKYIAEADTVSDLNEDEDEDEDIISRYGEAYCEGWYVILKRSPYECYLWNPTSRQKLRLPTVKNCTSFFSSKRQRSICKCVLSSPPTLGGCTVLFTSGCDRRILYCKVRDRQWVEQTYSGKHKYNEVTAFKRKIYAITTMGYMVEIVLGAKKLIFRRCEIEMPFLVIFAYRFVESCDDLFFVMMLSDTNSAVFKVDFSLKKLVQIYTLGDRIFFISNYYSGSLNGPEWGLRGNHIYYTSDSNKTLFKLDFEQAIISVTENQSNCSTIWFTRDGTMPIPRILNCRKEEGKIVENNIDAYESLNKSDSNWFKLPISIQQLIAESYLSHGKNYMNFRLVCKSWKSVAPSFFWRTSKSSNIAYPWLMYIGNNGLCNFHDPMENVTYTMRNPELSDCVIRFSKDGWLLLSQGPRSVILYEPFAKTKIKLPDLPVDYCFSSLSFSAAPSSSCCTVVGICNDCLVDVGICYLDAHNDTAWTEVIFEHDWFCSSLNNPVFVYGSFCFMDRNGRLGCFKINDEDETTWRYLNSPKPIRVLPTQFLMGSEEQLYSVFIGKAALDLVEVYRLNFTDFEWVKLESLENYTLFVSQTTSLAVLAHEERMKNKIYTSSLSNADNHPIFYSLDTKKYHTFDGGYNLSQGLYGTKEYKHSTWIQPSVVPTFCKSSQD